MFECRGAYCLLLLYKSLELSGPTVVVQLLRQLVRMEGKHERANVPAKESYSSISLDARYYRYAPTRFSNSQVNKLRRSSTYTVLWARNPTSIYVSYLPRGK